MLREFEKRGLIERRSSTEDARQIDFWLTRMGREEFSTLDSASNEEIAKLLNHLSDADQTDLICAMQKIETLFGEPPTKGAPFMLRPPRPGDMGWVVHRHGVLYAREYGWDEKFEALVAGIVADFVNQFDPNKERCWIAESDAKNAGSVFLVKKTDEIAKLRLLLVEPEARGKGIGSRLVDECICFARQVGYLKITLWTNDVLTAARKIYQKAGFRIVHQEPNLEFGHNVISETWEIEL
jgi:GNAT superfamily N-acetyltransferase